jgi:hypothetical protein
MLPPSSAVPGRSIITMDDAQSDRAHVYGPQSPPGSNPSGGVEFGSVSTPVEPTSPDSDAASETRCSHGSTGVAVAVGDCDGVPVVARADGVCERVPVLLRVAVGDGVAGVYV